MLRGLGCDTKVGDGLDSGRGMRMTVSRTSSGCGISSSASMWMLNSSGVPRSAVAGRSVGAADTRGDGMGAGGMGVYVLGCSMYKASSSSLDDAAESLLLEPADDSVSDSSSSSSSSVSGPCSTTSSGIVLELSGRVYWYASIVSRRVSESFVIRCFDLAGTTGASRKTGLSGASKKDPISLPKYIVLIRGGASCLYVGGDGGGVACAVPSEERAIDGLSESAYGSKVNYRRFFGQC